MEKLENAHLGEFILVMQPRAECAFRYSPAASVHAALMRRVELIDPELSAALHNALQGSRDSFHPWTVSQIKGLVREDDHLLAVPYEQYQVRITALAPRVIEGLVECFDYQSPMGSEPMFLENVPFDIVSDQSFWTNLTTYPSLLTRARPLTSMNMSFESPTAFASQKGETGTPEVTPLRCISGYVRKWNAFSTVGISEDDLLEYVEREVSTVGSHLRPANARFRSSFVKGVMGRVEWQARERSGNLLRLVNALADFAFYCGTGANVSRGMGHTIRSRR